MLRKIKLFLFYRKTILSIEKELYDKFFIRIDNAYRMYTVLNIPQEIIDEPYRMRKQDIDTLSSNYIREYSIDVSKFLNSKGLQELYGWYETKKVGKYNYLLIFGFSLFKTNKFIRSILFYVAPTILLLLSVIIFYLIKQ